MQKQRERRASLNQARARRSVKNFFAFYCLAFLWGRILHTGCLGAIVFIVTRAVPWESKAVAFLPLPMETILV